MHNVNSNTVVDGFTIKAGNAIGSPAIVVPPETSPPGTGTTLTMQGGGGILMYTKWTDTISCKPSIVRCKIEANKAVNGGGLFTYILPENISPTFQDCEFRGNYATQDGGAAHSDGGGAPCPNEVPEPGSQGSGPSYVNCLIVDNTAMGFGGGFYCDEYAPLGLLNCTITLNKAGESGTADGGGIYHENCYVSTTHGSLIGFSTLKNTIVWHNGVSPWNFSYQIRGARCIDYSCVESLSGAGPSGCGTGNITSDPLFVGSNDFRLQVDSANATCRTGGTIASFPQDEFDLDQDGCENEPVPDLDLKTRICSETISMGAYQDLCPADPCPADIAPTEGNNCVGVDDLLLVINSWGLVNTCGVLGDITGPGGYGVPNGTVNVDDLLAIINHWCACPGYTGSCGSCNFPASVSDCMEEASVSLTPYSEDWLDFVDKCVTALCEAEIIDCD